MAAAASPLTGAPRARLAPAARPCLARRRVSSGRARAGAAAAQVAAGPATMAGVSAGTPPYWQLISVLFSSVPLTSELAMSLYQVAVELYRGGQPRGEVMLERAQGRVRNLRRSFALGAIAGPGFEADVETERGAGRVRFLVTRQGLDRGERVARRRERAELPN